MHKNHIASLNEKKPDWIAKADILFVSIKCPHKDDFITPFIYIEF